MSTQRTKSSTRLEYIAQSNGKYKLNITKTAFAKAIKLITNASRAQLVLPYQQTLDEINSHWIFSERVNAEKERIFSFKFRNDIPGEMLLRYDTKQDAWFTLQGQHLTMGEDFVSVLSVWIVKTTWFGTPQETSSNEPDEF